MTFSSYLTNLIIPFNLCMTLVVIGLVLGLFRLRKTGGALIVAGLLWALAWSLPATSVWLGGALESRYPHLSPEQSPTADAIVVLGGNTANGRANWFLPYEKDKAVVRIDIAAQLYLAGRAPKVLLSGGALEGDVSEARGMAHAIRQQGVPETALILENSSRTTYENAAMTEDQLKARGIGKILLVTSALHMPRAMAAFAKQGVVAIAAPAPPQIVPPTDGSLSLWVPDQRTFDASRSIIKEYAGLFVYRLRGWCRSPERCALPRGAAADRRSRLRAARVAVVAGVDK